MDSTTNTTSGKYGLLPNELVEKSKTQVMSSREIAELTEKQHQHVRRDIEHMMSELGKDASKYGHTYLDSMNRKQNEYLLPRFETEILITGYDVKRRAAVIHRWFELESGKVVPLVQQQKEPKLPTNPLYQISVSEKALEMAKAFGFSGNAALISADHATRNMIGFSPLKAMGQKSLSAPVQVMTFTPTQLGQMMTPPTNPREVNKLLESSRAPEQN